LNLGFMEMIGGLFLLMGDRVMFIESGNMMERGITRGRWIKVLLLITGMGMGIVASMKNEENGNARTILGSYAVWLGVRIEMKIEMEGIWSLSRLEE
jgi:hypothetical protein